MMAGILILTFMVPVLIRAASRAFISRFAPAATEAQTEKEDDRYLVMEGFTETENDLQLSDPTDAGRNESTAASDGDDTQHEHDPDLVRKQLQ